MVWVFLGLDSSITCSELIKKVSDYRIVVIDAQCFTKKTVMALKRRACGIQLHRYRFLEDYRSYYAGSENMRFLNMTGGMASTGLTLLRQTGRNICTGHWQESL